jgi:hypothetical protein
MLIYQVGNAVKNTLFFRRIFAPPGLILKTLPRSGNGSIHIVSRSIGHRCKQCSGGRAPNFDGRGRLALDVPAADELLRWR